MSSDPLSITVRPMAVDDLGAIMELEKVSFPTPWSRDMYAHEITANPYGTYWVVVPAKAEIAADSPILAYGGLWLMEDEAHVTTIATHPKWRRRGLAGWLLIYLLELARGGGATSATLEVRMHNHAAIALYEKLGFVEVGVRKGYYVDTGEDARLLTLFGLDKPEVWEALCIERARIQGNS